MLTIPIRALWTSHIRQLFYKRLDESCGESRSLEKPARLMTTEMRKICRSRVDEAVKCRRVCRYCAENAQCFLANEWSTTASKSYLQYQARGVILVVMPWNYPILGWCSGSLLRARQREMWACSSTHRTSRSRR